MYDPKRADVRIGRVRMRAHTRGVRECTNLTSSSFAVIRLTQIFFQPLFLSLTARERYPQHWLRGCFPKGLPNPVATILSRPPPSLTHKFCRRNCHPEYGLVVVGKSLAEASLRGPGYRPKTPPSCSPLCGKSVFRSAKYHFINEITEGLF